MVEGGDGDAYSKSAWDIELPARLWWNLTRSLADHTPRGSGGGGAAGGIGGVAGGGGEGGGGRGGGLYAAKPPYDV